ncbi:hypothetical protein LOK49_LG10G00299 [Camellia lanceoleosa]|uniref:Uncharacterized protein n=1 Tax=Camellia lanceoleosa TaxID=1840588 RepID=A0ACC0G9W8_9ERIC|nr:hypothetical protein LOK49_LG10G00299 [Camellia lanceoleosa]
MEWMPSVIQLREKEHSRLCSKSYNAFSAAIQCLKRKRLYEQQIEQLGNFQLRIHDQKTTGHAFIWTYGKSAPIGAAADFDEDELEAELEELEGAEPEEQLLQPATSAPAAPAQVPAGRVPARPAPQKNTAEEDELAALQAEMAL